jgi:hypothetical protein
MSVKEPYWITRARAFLLEIPIFGQKSVIKQNTEILLFTVHDHVEKELPSSNDVRLNSNVDFFEKIYGRNDEKSIIKIYPEKNNYENKALIEVIETLPGYRKENIPVYNVVPELKTMKKSLSYVEIYLALSRFVDNKMMFINLFKKNVNINIASAVVYIPYTPLMLENASNYFIRSFANYLRLNCR